MTQKIRPVILLSCSAVLLCCFSLVLVYKLYLYDDDNSNNPLLPSSYSHTGYYHINPETILNELKQGKSDVFKPVSEDMVEQINWSDEPKYSHIYWSQTEYLMIVDTLSKEVWHEPFDSKNWDILALDMSRDCTENPRGFYKFSIVYFQDSKIEFLNRQYLVRRVEVIGWQGLVRWSDDTFSDAILPGWEKANLNNFQVTADDALLIAENNGGSAARQQHNNKCQTWIRLNNAPHAVGYTKNNWLIDYESTDFSEYLHIWVNPLSGKVQK